MGEKNKWTTKCDKSTATCDVGTAQCEDGTIKCEKKNKGTTDCDKSTVTCDFSTTQCEDGTIKCDVLVTWYSRLPTNGYCTPPPKKKGDTLELPYIKYTDSIIWHLLKSRFQELSIKMREWRKNNMCMLRVCYICFQKNCNKNT